MEGSPFQHEAAVCIATIVPIVAGYLGFKINRLPHRKALSEMRTVLASGEMTPDLLRFYELLIPEGLIGLNKALFKAARFSARQPPRPTENIRIAEKFLSDKYDPSEIPGPFHLPT